MTEREREPPLYTLRGPSLPPSPAPTTIPPTPTTMRVLLTLKYFIYKFQNKQLLMHQKKTEQILG